MRIALIGHGSMGGMVENLAVERGYEIAVVVNRNPLVGAQPVGMKDGKSSMLINVRGNIAPSSGRNPINAFNILPFT